METKKSRGLDWATLRLAVILFAFSAVVAVLLGLVNQVTKDPIAAYGKEKTARAMETVLAADSYEQIADSNAEKIELVDSIYRAGEAGYVVMVRPSGFGGEIQMAVGVDNDGCVTGISIIDMSETSGLGANAARESFRSQYVGKSGTVALRKQGGEIDALTGATVTSTAVTKGVNAALMAVREVQRGEA